MKDLAIIGTGDTAKTVLSASIAAHVGHKYAVVELADEVMKELQQSLEAYLLNNEYSRELVSVMQLYPPEMLYGGRQTPKKWRNCVNIPVGSDKKQGRNELCACGSGKKFKRCCK